VLELSIYIFVEEDKRRAGCLINLETFILDTFVDYKEELLNGLEVKLEEHKFQVIAEEGLDHVENLFVELVIQL
jgi:hypothetical protein